MGPQSCLVPRAALSACHCALKRAAHVDGGPWAEPRSHREVTPGATEAGRGPPRPSNQMAGRDSTGEASPPQLLPQGLSGPWDAA